MNRPYKGRKLRLGDKVYVYRNLHTKDWSVKALTGPHKGLVVAHVDDITLFGCEFTVNEAGRQRVLRDKRKNVHAGVVGHYDPALKPTQRGLCLYEEVKYNPYRGPAFVGFEGPVKAALVVHLDEEGKVWM